MNLEPLLDIEKVKARRIELKLSQAECADLSEMSGRASWSGIECGVQSKRGITLWRLAMMGRALQIQPRELLRTIDLKLKNGSSGKLSMSRARAKSR